MFDQLSSQQSRSQQSLVLSLAIHGALVIAILAVGFTVQSIVAPSRTTSVQWIAPIPIPLMKRRTIRPPKPAIRTVAKLPPIKLTAPPPEPVPTVLKAPRPISAIVASQPEPPAQAPVQKEASTAVTSPTKAPPKVQLGGFSTASTSSDQANPKLQVATVGFGDAGVAPAAASRRSVSSSGFGDAALASALGNSRAQVLSSGFGDAASAPVPSAITVRPPSPRPTTAAQILGKPRPAYTEEARRLEIEGEVQLEVVFGASGEVHILRVVRGLGHGLDENAVTAAKAIRFLPAKKDGHTVDSTATVHIIFQLAS
jgi:TonB family protein